MFLVLFSIPSSYGQDTEALREAITLENQRAHQIELQAIADTNGGLRVTAAPGYADSVGYVRTTLESAGQK